jgi:glycolate oxidase iron-sulfur subunit
MQTNLAPEFKARPKDGEAAEAILRKCVHCGFCTATCPTYQLLGDELDGPRGRIYLIKQVLEGRRPTRSHAAAPGPLPDLPQLRDHLPQRRAVRAPGGHRPQDRRAKVRAPGGERPCAGLLKEGLTSPLFGPAMKLGQLARPLLPAALKAKVPARRTRAQRWPTRTHARKVLMLLGCVQPAMMPNINSATARVLDAAGIQTLVADEGRLLRRHPHPPGRPEGGLADMRRNIDAWWPLVDGPHERRQGRGHRDERQRLRRHRQGLRPRAGARPDYADKAARISALTRT